MLSTFLPPTLLALAPTPLPQDDGVWPWFDGPRHDGVSLETDWNSTGAEEPLWKARVGQGYSAPSVRDGRLFTQGFDEENELDRLVCLDAETGEEIWGFEWPAQQRANFHRGGSLTTPAVDGDRVYATNRFGLLLCFEASSGELLWDRQLAEELEIEVTFHGFSSSILVLEDRLVLVLGRNTLALDKRDQEVLWRHTSTGPSGYSNPVPLRWRDQDCIAVLQGTALHLLDSATGKALASHPWVPPGNGVNVCAPVVVGDRVFLSTGYEKGCTLLSLAGDQPVALWENKVLRNHVGGVALHEEHLYGFDEAVLKCIDLQGEEAWRVRGIGKGTLSIAGDRLLVMGSKGELIVAAADPTEYRELSRRKVLDDGEYWTRPVLVGGLIYCRNSLGDLVCLDHRTKTDTDR